MKLLFISLVMGGVACSSELSPKEIHDQQEGLAFWKKVAVEALTMPPDQAIQKLGSGVRKTAMPSIFEIEGTDEVHQLLQQALLSIPGHAQYYADEIERERSALKPGQPKGDYDFKRDLDFQVLRYLPSPETVKVLGGLLYDDRDPLPRPTPTQDWTDLPANSFLAAETLIRVGLRKPPVSEKNIDGDQILLDRCRAWWEKVKSGAIAISFVGQNVEYRFKPDGTWDTTPIANRPDDAPKPPKAANPHHGTIPQQTQLPKDNESPSVRHLLEWIGGAAIAVLAGILWLRRKTSSDVK